MHASVILFQWRMPQSKNRKCPVNALPLMCAVYSILFIWGISAGVDNIIKEAKRGYSLETSGNSYFCSLSSWIVG